MREILKSEVKGVYLYSLQGVKPPHGAKVVEDLGNCGRVSRPFFASCGLFSGGTTM